MENYQNYRKKNQGLRRGKENNPRGPKISANIQNQKQKQLECFSYLVRTYSVAGTAEDKQGPPPKELLLRLGLEEAAAVRQEQQPQARKPCGAEHPYTAD